MSKTGVKYLNRNQLIRVKEIFNPFFKVFDENCLSYSIYRVVIQAEMFNKKPYLSLDFMVSDINGSMKTDSIMYSLNEDDLFYSDSFKFEEGSNGKILSAVKKMMLDLDTIPIKLNKLIVESGSRWTLGVLGDDIDPKTKEKYDGSVLFLKSDLMFSAYSLSGVDDAYLS